MKENYQKIVYRKYLIYHINQNNKRYHLIPGRVAIINNSTTSNGREDMQKRELSFTLGGILNWYNHYGKQYTGTLENSIQNYHMTQQSHFWAYIQTKLSLKDTCTSMLIAALFTEAKMWKNLNAHRQISGLQRCGVCVYIYTHTYTQWNTTQP